MKNYCFLKQIIFKIIIKTILIRKLEIKLNKDFCLTFTDTFLTA